MSNLCGGRFGFEIRFAVALFPEQTRVRHSSWGEGLVLRHEGDSIVVLFDDVGYKTLSLDVVVERSLLEAVA